MCFTAFSDSVKRKCWMKTGLAKMQTRQMLESISADDGEPKTATPRNADGIAAKPALRKYATTFQSGNPSLGISVAFITNLLNLGSNAIGVSKNELVMANVSFTNANVFTAIMTKQEG